jgi:formylglycine-generating enzyme required for sulfatase activity
MRVKNVNLLRKLNDPWARVIAALIAGIFTVIAILIATNEGGAPTTIPTTAVIQNPTETLLTSPTETSPETPTLTLTETASITPSNTPTNEPTLSGFHLLQTTEAERTRSAEIQIALNLTATEESLLSANVTGTAQQLAATETSAYATLTVLSATPTPIPLGFLGNLVTSNDQWTSVIQEFNGVEMVLVPAGCFTMGSEDGYPYEQPAHPQCFDDPFWIDRFEVTNVLFNELGGLAVFDSGSSGSDRPRTNITWLEARDFCISRDARLPTEREWEYSARGPNNLKYPWGNVFPSQSESLDYIIYFSNSGEFYRNGITFDVGEEYRRNGISWVGAYDMSGNVFEWTSTINGFGRMNEGKFELYERIPYPYNDDDGRELDSDEWSVVRVTRGGAFNSHELDVTTTYRYGLTSNNNTFAKIGSSEQRYSR